MTLRTISKAHIQDGEIHTKVKGWEVSVYREERGYRAHIFVLLDESSDATVTLNIVRGRSLAILRESVKEAINDSPVSVTKARTLGINNNAVEVTVHELI